MQSRTGCSDSTRQKTQVISRPLRLRATFPVSFCNLERMEWLVIAALLIFGYGAATGSEAAGCIQQLSRCPENQSVPLGTTASFHCEVQPSLSQLYEVDWIVQLKDGSIHHQHNLLSLQEMGFAPDDGELIGSNLTLRVLGTEKTSNSRITCRVYEHESGQVYFAEVANLIVTAGCLKKLSRCPESQTIPLGSTVSFHCEVQPNLSQLYEVDWIVQLKDGSIHHQHNLLSLQEMGFAPDNGELTGSNLTLRVLGTEKTNNSRITCRVFEHESGQVYFTEVANLIVAGLKEAETDLTVGQELHCEKVVSEELLVVSGCSTNKHLSHILYSITGEEPQNCTFPLRIDFSVLPLGTYSLVIVATDIFNSTKQAIIQYTKPALQLQFIHDSPRAERTAITAEFAANRPVEEMTCFLSEHGSKNCSMGTVSYRELESKTYTLRVVARAKNGDTAVLKRRVRTGDSCLLNMINEGLSVNGTSISVQFLGSADVLKFRCKLDKGHFYKCMSPVQILNLSAGAHQFDVKPAGCSGARRRLSFFISA